MTWPHDVSLPSLQRISDAHAFLALEHSTPQAISDWQTKRKAELRDWLITYSPWWSDRLSKAGSAIPWTEIPQLSRAELRKMVADHGVVAMPSHHGTPITRGFGVAQSEGIGFYTSNFQQRIALHAFYADHHRQGRNPFARQACISDEVPPHSGTQTEMKANLETGCGEQLFRRGELFSDAQHIEWLTKVKPKYLTVDSKWLDVILARARSSRAGLPEIQQILTHGTEPSREARTQARQLFGAVLKYRYTLPECGPLGFQCPRDDEFLHVAVANVAVEVVNNDTQPLTGNQGRVLVTALHQYATPIVRYDVGNYAVLHTHCPGCGLAISTLSNLKQSI